MIFGLLALLIILFTSPLHAAEDVLFVRDANLLKAKSLRCLFTRQVTTNWTSWETTWSKEATIENMEDIFAAIPQKGSKARLIKRVPGEPSGIQEVFIIRTLEALNFLEVNPERPIHTTAVMVMRENREAGTFVATTSQHTITKDGAVVPGHIMKVCLSCDHRVVDGATGAAFLQDFKNLLENPVLMLV